MAKCQHANDGSKHTVPRACLILEFVVKTSRVEKIIFSTVNSQCAVTYLCCVDANVKSLTSASTFFANGSIAMYYYIAEVCAGMSTDVVLLLLLGFIIMLSCSLQR